MYLSSLQNSKQSEDTLATTPPQEEFSKQTVHTKHEDSEGVGPDLQENSVQGHIVRRQGSECKSRSNCVRNNLSKRSRSLENLSSSENSLSTREAITISSGCLTRRSIDMTSSPLLAGRRNTTRDESLEQRDKSPEQRDKSPEQRNGTADKTPLSNDTSSDSDNASSSVPLKLVASSLKSSTSSLSSVTTAEANNQPSCTVGEKVMVDTPIGFKFGKVKFVGSTEFAAGEWIGVALERPNGKFVVCLHYHICIYYLIRKT